MAKAIQTIGTVVGAVMIVVGVATGNLALAVQGTQVMGIAPASTPAENVIGFQKRAPP